MMSEDALVIFHWRNIWENNVREEGACFSSLLESMVTEATLTSWRLRQNEVGGCVVKWLTSWWRGDRQRKSLRRRDTIERHDPSHPLPSIWSTFQWCIQLWIHQWTSWYKFTSYWKEPGKYILTHQFFFCKGKEYVSKEFIRKHRLYLAMDLFNTRTWSWRTRGQQGAALILFKTEHFMSQYFCLLLITCLSSRVLCFQAR